MYLLFYIHYTVELSLTAAKRHCFKPSATYKTTQSRYTHPAEITFFRNNLLLCVKINTFAT